MALRAFWQHHNRHGQIDRIEVHDAEFSGTEFELCGDSTGFSFRHDEITSESNEKLINIQANRVQIGKLDFRPRIESTAGESLLTDIRDSDNKRFHIEWYRDGNFEWAGWITTRIFSYPEKESGFFAHIRATDFEILKGIDYPLDDTRQTFISTLSGLFSELPVSTPIRTATSWVEENVTAAVGSTTYDFLNEIYHETKALREFARTGDETDQPITKWEALERIAEPALLIRQMNGHIYIDQITELADPTTVNETTYDSTGTVTTPTANADRRQTGYTSVSSGTPAVKITSNNDTYPAIKQARNKYDHRTAISGVAVSFPNTVELLDSQTQSESQFFLGDGTQYIRFGFSVNAETDLNEDDMQARYQMTITTTTDTYYLQDDGSWSTTVNAFVEVDLTMRKPLPSGGAIWDGSESLTTDPIPDAADGTLEVTFAGATGTTDFADETNYWDIFFQIVDPVAEKNSTSIDYQLTQTPDFPTVLQLEDTWFGDGPEASTVGALKHDDSNSALTADTWQRRGSTAYRNYHENLLKEVLDMGRTNMRKLQADIWGSYDPSKVLDYNGSYFFYAGGRYDGVTGKWQVTLMGLDLVEDGTDTFDDIPKFTDETGSGSGSTSTGGGGGGLDQSTADARYFRQSNNLSEGDSATIRSNIDVYSTTEAHSQFLDEALNLSDLTNITAAQDNLGLTDGSADLLFNSLRFDNHEWGDFDTDGDVYHDASAGLYVKSINASNNKVGGNLLWSSGNFHEGTNISVIYDGEDEPTLSVVDTPVFDGLVSNANITLRGRLQASQNGGDLDILFANDGKPIIRPNGQVSSDIIFQDPDWQFDTPLTVRGLLTLDNGADLQSQGDILNVNSLNVSEITSNNGNAPVTVTQPFWFDDTGGRSVDYVIRADAAINAYGNPVAMRFDNGHANITAHDGFGNFNLLSGLDENNEVVLSDGGTRVRLNDGGLARIEIYSGAAGNPGVLENRFTIGTTVTTFQNSIDSASGYVSGILGAGTRWDSEASGGTFFEIDNMRVRNELRAHIFKKDVVRTSNGYLLISDSAQIAENKTLADNTAGQTLEIKAGDGNSTFSIGDLLWAKNIRDDGSLVINGVKAEVTGIDTSNSDYTVLTLDTSNGGNGGELFDGDTIVRVSGGYLMNDASSQFSPFLDVYDGVNTWSDFQDTGKLKGRYGNLEGLTIDGVALNGYGLYSNNAWLTDQVVVGDFNLSNNYLAFDGASLSINAEIFDLTAGDLQIRSDIPFVRVGTGTSSQVGITGISSATDVAFWAGGYYSNRDTAPVFIRGNGSGQFAGGDFTWDVNGNVNLTGTITASAGEIGGFTIGSSSLFTNNGTGKARIIGGTGHNAFRVRPDTSQGGAFDFAELYWNNSSGNWGIRGREGGQYLFQLGSTNEISGWTIDSTRLMSPDTNLRIDSANNLIGVGFGSSGGQTGMIAGYAAGDVTIYSGTGFANRDNAPFRVTFDGFLTAQGATIEGHVDALTGSLGDLDVDGILTVETTNNVTPRIDAGRLRYEHSNKPGLDRMWLGYAPNFTSLDGDALGLTVSDINSSGTGSNSALRSAVTWAEMGFRNSGDTDWLFRAHYQDGVRLREVEAVDYQKGTDNLGTGEQTLNVTAPIMEVDAEGGTRIVEINTNQVASDISVIFVMNTGSSTFGYRDQNQTSHTGANVIANDQADYKHNSGTNMTLVKSGSGDWFVGNAFGA